MFLYTLLHKITGTFVGQLANDCAYAMENPIRLWGIFVHPSFSDYEIHLIESKNVRFEDGYYIAIKAKSLRKVELYELHSFGTDELDFVCENQLCVAKARQHVIACENATVVSSTNTSIELYDRSYAFASNRSSVISYDNSTVLVQEFCYVDANDQSNIYYWDTPVIIVRSPFVCLFGDKKLRSIFRNGQNPFKKAQEEYHKQVEDWLYSTLDFETEETTPIPSLLEISRQPISVSGIDTEENKESLKNLLFGD